MAVLREKKFCSFARPNILPRSRPARIEMGSMKIVEIGRARMLIVTSVTPKHHISREDMRMDLLLP